jgi:hypothetical protein
MGPTEVEERMSAFYERKYDVLLSTTIIESGIDIPARTRSSSTAPTALASRSCTSCAAAWGASCAPMPI